MALTSEESAWLDQHKGTILVGIEEDYPPFVSYNNGVIEGISIDYLNLVTEKLGTGWSYDSPDSLPHLLDEAKQGKLDLITSLTYNSERAKFLDFTDSYIKVPAGMFSKDRSGLNIDFANERGFSVAVGDGYAAKRYLENQYPGLRVVPVKNDLEGLKMVSEGKVDIAVADLGSASYLIQKESIKGVYFVGATGFTYDLSFAFSKGNEVMVNAFNQALLDIPSDVNKQIESKWFKFSTAPFYLSNIFFFILAFVVFIIIAMSYWLTLRNKSSSYKSIKKRK
jgi:ABC-type amino acid transport substrate-binding protein